MTNDLGAFFPFSLTLFPCYCAHSFIEQARWHIFTIIMKFFFAIFSVFPLNVYGLYLFPCEVSRPQLLYIFAC